MARRCATCDTKFNWSYMWCLCPLAGHKRLRDGSIVGISGKTGRNTEEECIPETNKKTRSEDQMMEW